jgi:hypothetical protein
VGPPAPAVPALSFKLMRSPQAVLSKRIKEIAETRVRYGYRPRAAHRRKAGVPQRSFRLRDESEACALTERPQILRFNFMIFNRADNRVGKARSRVVASP